MINSLAMRCPAPGKGKRQLEWDFGGRLRRHRTSGIRDETSSTKRPLCQEDFVEYYTTKAPFFRSVSSTN